VCTGSLNFKAYTHGLFPERGELFEEVAADKLVNIGELFQERGRSFLDSDKDGIGYGPY